MSLPEKGTIGQKMTQDRLPPAERQDALFRGELGVLSLSKTAEPSSELEKYTKMKKMNLPEGAIRQRKLSESVSPQETVATVLKKPNDEVSL